MMLFIAVRCRVDVTEGHAWKRTVRVKELAEQALHGDIAAPNHIGCVVRVRQRRERLPALSPRSPDEPGGLCAARTAHVNVVRVPVPPLRVPLHAAKALVRLRLRDARLTNIITAGGSFAPHLFGGEVSQRSSSCVAARRLDEKPRPSPGAQVPRPDD